MKELWIVGDSFLRQTYETLQKLRSASQDKRVRRSLYAYDYYNVTLYFPSGTSTMRSVMAKLLNAAAEGLNQKEKLPKYVLLVLDGDLIKNLNFFAFGMTEMFEKAIDWLVKNLMKMFDRRRDDLKSRRPGAVSLATEPRYLWVAMITRPIIEAKEVKDIYAARGKFNHALENTLAEYKYNHIMYLDHVTEHKYFDSWGNLTNAGQEIMWKEINTQLEMFDKEELSLKPRSKKGKLSKLPRLKPE